MRYLFFLISFLILIQGCQNNGSPGSASLPGSSSSSQSASSETGSSSSAGKPAPELNYGCTVPSKLSEPQTRPMLVIRVNYNDIAFRNGASAWSRKIFGSERHQLNHYYRSISYGRFGFAAAEENDGAHDGIITVSLDKNHPDSGAGSSIHPDLATALRLADPYIDYSRYDKDGNGALTPDELLLMFIIAGYEDAFSGGEHPAVWAHQSCTLGGDAPVLDGVALTDCRKGGNYALFGERHTDRSIHYDHDATIGIIAHELGHAIFDLPDLYDTSTRSAGIGYFGLMGSGMWGQESLNDLYGNTPVSMSAWSKIRNGWIRPDIVTNTPYADIVLADTDETDYNIALLPVGKSQCFLIENRSTSGYDAGLNIIKGFYQGGLAVWHIDQEVIDQGSASNTVNADAGHKGVDLEEASHAGLDDNARFTGDARNLYYRGNKTRFGDDTDPSSRRYDGSKSGVAVFNITDPGSMMQAVVTNPNKVVNP